MKFKRKYLSNVFLIVLKSAMSVNLTFYLYFSLNNLKNIIQHDQSVFPPIKCIYRHHLYGIAERKMFVQCHTMIVIHIRTTKTKNKEQSRK